MTPRHIFETVLYADDLDAAEAFYRQVLGLDVLLRDEEMIALRCGVGVLLIFDPAKTRREGRGVPSHGATGPGHVAFAATDAEIEAWKTRLTESGIAIEAQRRWESGGRSIYFRDPGGNVLEFAPPTLWGGGREFAS